MIKSTIAELPLKNKITPANRISLFLVETKISETQATYSFLQKTTKPSEKTDLSMADMY